MEGREGTEERVPVTVSVVRTVSAYTDTEPSELPPLGYDIDADALEGLVESLDVGVVDFEYAGVPLSVHSDGTVEVRGISGEEPSQEGA